MIKLDQALFEEQDQFITRHVSSGFAGTVSMASYWAWVAHFALPPPLLLTVLLILPTPIIVQKGILVLVRNVLFVKVVGRVQLVHLMLILTGLAFSASSMNTYRFIATLHDTEAINMTPNQRMGLLGRKWREERNFWIAALTFLLWGLLYRFYALMTEHSQLRDRLVKVEAMLVASQPSAPPLPRFEPTLSPSRKSIMSQVIASANSLLGNKTSGSGSQPKPPVGTKAKVL